MSRSKPVKPGTPWGAIFSFAAALLYGVSPIDLIPDLIPLLGFVDDAIAVPLMIIWSVVLFARYRRRSRATAHIIDTEPVRRAESEPVIPQSYERAI